MVGTCALNDMNANMKLIGIFILIILLSIVVIYFMYCSRNKHSEILENFTSNEAALTYHNYGSEHEGQYEDYDKKTITGNVTLRDCQVYFVGEDQQGDCDEEYRANPNTTCKYVFKDDWKEIANIKVGEGEGNNYANKIYNQSYTYTEKDIKNHHLTAQCVKKFESESDKRYIYRDNELIVYNHDGSSDGNTLELNYKTDESDESDEYVKGDFISMKFGNNGEPSDNYTNVIDSICSKRYNDQPNLKVGDIFYKFKLNDYNQIISVEYAKVKSDKKSFEIVDIDLNEFADSKSTNFSYNEDTNSINVIKGAEVNPENVTIYKFEYDYLCGYDNYAGIIKGFTTSDFTMNKHYVDSIGMTPITKTIGPIGSDEIIIPEKLKKIFKVENLNTDSIISSLRKEGEELIKITNVDPKIEKGKLSRLIEAYNKKIEEAEDNKETFGINKSADYIFNYNFEKIIESNFVEIVGNDKENITSIADKEKVPYTFGFTKGYEKYIADVKFSNKLIETSVTPAPVFANETEQLQYKVEQLSGVKGWRLVKFLPSHLKRWFTPTPFNSISQSNVYIGTAYDYTNEFMVPFGTYDEMFFSSLDLKHWLHTTSNAVWGKWYGNEPRQVLKSSANPNNHYVRWYNRYGVVEDPWIGVKDHHSRPNLVLYGESKRLIYRHHHSYVRDNHGGLCVFVRDSSANIETFTAKTDNRVYTFKHDGSNSHHTAHKIKFNGLVKCEILVIGGGGGGGSRFGGGGGAGLLYHRTDYNIENGELKIYVGKGGIGFNKSRSGNGSNGHDSYIIHSVTGELIRAKGGGGGACDTVCGNGSDGGSGGGASYNNNTRGGRTSQHESQFAFGNVGGNGNWKNHARHGRVTGGGGGAGGPGKGNEAKTSPDGGPGKMINITGIPTYYAAGGGGASSSWDAHGHDAIGKGGEGGGGDGGGGIKEFYSDRVYDNSCWPNRGNINWCGTQGLCCRNSHHGCTLSGYSPPPRTPSDKHYCVRTEAHKQRPTQKTKEEKEAQNGKNHTGSGGGGAVKAAKGGDGGSGIVIIKITKITDEGMVIPVYNWIEADTYFKTRRVEVKSKLYAEPFTIGHLTSVEKQEKRACKIGGYIFLERNTYFDTTFILNYEGFVYNYSLLTIEKINSGGSKTVVKNIKPDDSDKTFSISTSGFYTYEITVVMFSQNIILTDIDFSLHCKKGSSRIPINLKDYLYTGRVYPIDYDTLAPHVSTELKIEKFNRYIRNILMTNNTVDSLREFKENVLNNYLKDYFNIFFWNSCNIMAKAKNNAIFILEEGCIPTNGDTVYRENCTLLNNIKKLKSQILRYTSITEINKLFEDTEFKAPGFNTNINITDEFTSDSHNINNFITHEKEDDYLKRTQRKKNDIFFKFTENAEKSIYVKRLQGKDLIL